MLEYLLLFFRLGPWQRLFQSFNVDGLFCCRAEVDGLEFILNLLGVELRGSGPT